MERVEQADKDADPAPAAGLRSTSYSVCGTRIKLKAVQQQIANKIQNDLYQQGQYMSNHQLLENILTQPSQILIKLFVQKLCAHQNNFFFSEVTTNNVLNKHTGFSISLQNTVSSSHNTVDVSSEMSSISPSKALFTSYSFTPEGKIYLKKDRF